MVGTVFQRADGSLHDDPVEAAMFAELLSPIDSKASNLLRDAAIKRVMEIQESNA